MIREGAFDPGKPPEPVREMSASEADKVQTETFREKALRRAREAGLPVGDSPLIKAAEDAFLEYVDALTAKELHRIAHQPHNRTSKP